ncbi:MAG: MBL fold metallo-hydrolase [Eubacteriales bacterium]|nr:MBL fold metallo-hydrolase [Eubacteriales bacterium]
MEGQYKVTYLEHSSFLVETDKCYLLFDYWKGQIPALDYKKALYVFASHAHHDHYSKEIYRLENLCEKVYYILSFDIKKADRSYMTVENVTFMDAHEKKAVGDLQVETFLSTDEGVAFLLELDGKTIYHAGDLHWWEWPGEPEEENEAYIAAYKKEMEKLKGRKLDLAFVVLDPRQEEAGGRGMDYFLAQIGARYVFPMHLWGEYSLIAAYKMENQLKYINSRIMDIHKAGDIFEIMV